MGLRYTDNKIALPATAASVTAANALPIDASMRQMKSITFTAASITSGNGVFGVDVSNDGTNWITYNRLISNVTNTNAQNDTRVAAPTLSSNTSQIFFFPATDLFKLIRVYCAVTTDGSYSAVLEMAG